MEAKITGFKGGRRTAYTDHPIIECTEGKSSELIGKKIFWKTATGKTISGRIVKPHGKTAYLTRFARNLPGNIIGDTVLFGSPAQKIKQKPKKTKAKATAKPVTPKKAEKKEVKPKKAVKKKAKTAAPKKTEKKKSPPKKVAEKKVKPVKKTTKKTVKKAPTKAKKTTKPAKKAKSKK